MADDIDIEEHDVLDHPKIQDIFPDLSLVKTEVMDEVDEFPYEDYVGFNAAAAIKVEPGTSYSETSSYVQPHKIILGSKPSLSQVYKPSQQLTLKDLEDPDIDAYVVIENMGPQLERSSCYCEKCEILFATVNALDAHKMTAHSFLVAVPSNNRAIKSTAKKQGPEEGVTFCNHCNKTFPDNASLIKHLYNAMTLKCDECGLTFNSENEKKSHQHVHTQSSSLEPKSTVFRCSVCKSYFGKEMHFKLHMKSNHKIPEHEIDLQKRMFDQKCFFCPGYFSSLRSYKDHVSKHHSKFFFKDMSQNPSKFPATATKNMQVVAKMPQSLAKTVPSVTKVSHNLAQNMQSVTTGLNNVMKNPYKCLLCNMEMKYVLYHKKKFHANLNLSDIPILKLISDKGKQNTGQLPLRKYIDKPRYPLTQIPKSVLFKCSTCEVYFLAAYIVMAHAKSCKTYGGKMFALPCSVPDCQKKFREGDLYFHELQHQQTSSFHVIILENRVFYNILNKCGKCGCMINDIDFGPHMHECDGVASEKYCEYCNLEIHSKSFSMHMKRHALKKTNSKNIKIIEYILISDVTARTTKPVPCLKRKRPTESTHVAPKQAKLTTKFKLFVCKHCRCVMPTVKRLKGHQSRKCALLKKIICRFCGLLVTYRSAQRHYMLHDDNGLNVHNFGFFDLFTSKPTTVPITKLPYCKECDIYYGTFSSFRLHNCCANNPSKICPHCKWSIELRYFKNHVYLHEVNMKLGNINRVTDKKVEKDTDEGLSELLKKYQSLQSTWNILYKCKTCEMFTDSYDATVEHSQWHFSSSLNIYKVILKNCEICKFSFNLDCYIKHVELHKNSRVNKNSFNILQYNYKNLHSRKWFEMFKDFSDDQIRQIMSMSMYEHTRSVKLELDKEGSKDGTLYKCATCKVAVSPADLRKHVDQDDCLRPQLKQLLLECTTCNVSFSSQKMYVQHCVYHGNNPNPLRVLLFNKPEDEDFNLAMTISASNEEHYNFGNDTPPQIKKPISELKQKTPNVITSSNKPIDVNRNIYCFYRCRKCNSSLRDKAKLHQHTCNKRFSKCIHCGLHIYVNFFKTHLKNHKINKTFNRNNFKVTDFIITDSGIAKFYTPKYLSPNKVKSTFPTKMKTYTNYATSKNTLFKCSRCNICFLCDKSLIRHVTLGKTRDSVTCELCSLQFNTQATLSKHKYFHHLASQCKQIDFRFIIRECETVSQNVTAPITEETQESTKLNSTKKIGKKITLYQCFMCPVLFESMRSLERHMSKSLDVHNVPRTPCSHCGLIFSKKCIVNHRLYHEKLHLTRADFIVKTNTVLQCSKCLLNFHWSINFKRHVDKSLCADNGIEKQRCDVCDIDFLKTDLPRHTELFHTVLNLKVTDVTFVTKMECVKSRNLEEYDLHKDATRDIQKLCLDQKSTIVRKVPSVEQESSTIYKCYDCGLHFMTSELLLIHFENKSHLTLEDIQDTCTVCNIEFSKDGIAEHIVLHHDKLKLNYEDFTVIEMYILYQCSCQVYFHQIRGLRVHIESKHGLKQKKIKCNYCNYTFSSWNIRRHIKISHIDRDIKREDFTIVDLENVKGTSYTHPVKPIKPSDVPSEKITPIKTSNFAVTNSFTKQVSTIKQTKDKSSVIDENALSRTIYKCYECGLHFVTPELLVRHFECKGKYYLDRIQATCSVCKIDFTRDGIARHHSLHHGNLNLNNDNFIVKEMFLLYECSSCQMYFHHIKGLQDHIDKNHGRKTSTVNCEHCNYAFSTFNMKRHLKLFHEDRNVKREDFTILKNESLNENKTITLNAIGDVKDSELDIGSEHTSDLSLPNISVNQEILKTEQNNKDTSTIEHNKDIDTSEIELNKDIVPCEFNVDDMSRTIYKCYECHLHFVTPALLISHFKMRSKYNIDEIREKCTVCNINFTSDGIEHHQQLHHEKLQMNHEDFAVKEMFIVYKCRCQACFHQLCSLQNHINTKQCNRLNITKCTYCNLNFSAISIKRHIKMFHIDRNVKREDITVLGVNDTNNTQTIKSDVQTVKSQDPVEKRALDIIPIDTSDVSPKPNTSRASISPNNAKYKLKLYKCKPCNVYFLSQNSCYKHAHKHEPMDPKEYIECKLCNLQFSFMSLHIHMRKHHIQQEHQPEDILVEEYLPSVGQNAPIINIYYLKDRLQSELVTTTSEILKDAAASIDNEKPASVSAQDACKKTEQSETILADSSETERLELNKDASPKVYKRKSKDDNEGQTATPCTELKTNSYDIKDTAVVNNSLRSNLSNKVDDEKTNDALSVEAMSVDVSAVVEEKNEFRCDFCEESFKTNIALEFHISLDHIDEVENCAICNTSLNKSILTTLHLESFNNNFKCCICKVKFKVEDLQNHALLHR